jgi:hypothetical protein
MKSSGLILLSFFILAPSARADEVPGPATPPVSHFRGPCDDDPNGMKFAGKACYTRYDPSDEPFGSGYVPPHCDKDPQLTSGQRRALAMAYVRAPQYAKDKLCRLTQLFVTHATKGGDWDSWGLWEGPDRLPGTGVYVAISEQYLASKQSFADVENQTVDQLLHVDGRTRYGARLPRLRTADPADPELTVLGALAHELGHVLLADTNADGTDPRHPRRRVSGKPSNDCFEHAILDSWDADTFHNNMRRWVDFGDANHNRLKNLRFDLKSLRSAVRRGNLEPAIDAITEVYRSGEFASFFAAISPEEDFVGTYEYKVIKDAVPKAPVTLRLRRREINVLELLGSGGLAGKVQCLQNLGLLTPQQ